MQVSIEGHSRLAAKLERASNYIKFCTDGNRTRDNNLPKHDVITKNLGNGASPIHISL